MHKKLKQILKNRIQKGEKFLVPYLTFGYPTVKEFIQILLKIAEYVELIEIGMPFSDPLADGLVIQNAYSIALKNAVSLSKLLETLSNIKDKHNSKLILMSYLNPCLRYNLSKLFKDMNEAGLVAAIFPDLPYGEANSFLSDASRNDVDIIYLVSPTTPTNRTKVIMKASEPFVYAVSVKGITGIRKELPKELPDWLNKLRKLSNTPIFVGFGISTHHQITNILPHADGFIIGSVIINLIKENKSKEVIDLILKMKSIISFKEVKKNDSGN